MSRAILLGLFYCSIFIGTGLLENTSTPRGDVIRCDFTYFSFAVKSSSASTLFSPL